MEQIQQPTIIVIVGITGDLSRRKLLPAIRQIAASGVLPEDLKIVGITRRDVGLDSVLPDGDQEFLRKYLELYKMDLTANEDYEKLDSYLKKLESGFDKPAQRLFYLSVSPQVAEPIIGHLGKTGLASHPDTKLLVEKPFGLDLKSAESLIDHIMQHFDEDRIYRIDHYLAKEMVQNLIIFRRSNPLFAHTWSHDFIEKIDIVASEEIDIEGRASFYEQTGALGDLVQSHLMQLTALTLMDTPKPDGSVPELRLKALKSLISPSDVAATVIRGQYEGYRKQVDNPASHVETFVSLTLKSNDENWKNVPITITTGKALSEKVTEIRVYYRRGGCPEANELILRIQPNEGIEVRLWVKEPGYKNQLQQLPLDFAYKQHFANLPEAYERVFVDAMRSDHSLFTTSDEVLASWHVLEPIQHAWSMSDTDLIIYPKGSTAEEVLAKAASNAQKQHLL